VWRAEVTDNEHGFVEYDAPIGRDKAQLLRERLQITIAAEVLVRDRRYGSDGPKAMDLARRIASPTGEPCMAEGREVSRVLDEARREVLALSETRAFQIMHKLIRELLDERGWIEARDLATIHAVATGKSLKTSTPTPKARATSAARKTGRAKARTNGCRSCGSAYAPRHETGRCWACRRAA
jgi:hypothetical protein